MADRRSHTRVVGIPSPMLPVEPTEQLTFRFPKSLIARVEERLSHFQARGLDVSRADVVRLLVSHALAATAADFDALLEAPRKGSRARR